ncbi:type II toxin-antitoxin system RelE/ParE family toxin [Myxococcota bacterium]|nr:type II toxin-antitoxin system RelE/ParE family toxin [Myxococcota bacterium]
MKVVVEEARDAVAISQTRVADVDRHGSDCTCWRSLTPANGPVPQPPGNRLERLRDGRSRQHSIRIHDQWRLAFAWPSDGPHDIEICDYHSGEFLCSAERDRV